MVDQADRIKDGQFRQVPFRRRREIGHQGQVPLDVANRVRTANLDRQAAAIPSDGPMHLSQ